jgi:uncharacterized protein DUF485
MYPEDGHPDQYPPMANSSYLNGVGHGSWPVAEAHVATGPAGGGTCAPRATGRPGTTVPGGGASSDSGDAPTGRTAFDMRAADRRAVGVASAVVSLYLLNAVLAQVAPGVLGLTVVGTLNVGFTLALLLLAGTVGAVQWYGRHARTAPVPMERPGSVVRQWEARR